MVLKNLLRLLVCVSVCAVVASANNKDMIKSTRDKIDQIFKAEREDHKSRSPDFELDQQGKMVQFYQSKRSMELVKLGFKLSVFGGLFESSKSSKLKNLKDVFTLDGNPTEDELFQKFYASKQIEFINGAKKFNEHVVVYSSQNLKTLSFTNQYSNTSYFITPRDEAISLAMSVTHEFVMSHDFNSRNIVQLIVENAVTTQEDLKNINRIVNLSYEMGPAIRLFRAYILEEKVLSGLDSKSSWYQYPLYKRLKDLRAWRSSGNCMKAMEEVLEVAKNAKLISTDAIPLLKKALSKSGAKGCLQASEVILTEEVIGGEGGGPRSDVRGG